MDEIEITDSVEDAEPAESDDAEQIVAEKSHGTDDFGDGSVKF